MTARILVVEDSDEDFDTIEVAARQLGWRGELQRATTGGDGLAVLQRRELRPVLVLMDLNTPGIDGREALASIKRDPGLRTLPVVVLTTSGNPTDVAYCYNAGANAYHVKPISYPDHVATLVTLLDYWLGHVLLPAPRAAT